MQQEETKTVLETKVANYKLIAREALRMELISPRLSRITAIENDLKEINETIEFHNHRILVEKYEISKLDTEHPDYENTKKNKEEEIKYHEEMVEARKKTVVEVEKLITEQRENIAKIESGETKVSLDALNELVSKLIKQDALNQVAV